MSDHAGVTITLFACEGLLRSMDPQDANAAGACAAIARSCAGSRRARLPAVGGSRAVRRIARLRCLLAGCSRRSSSTGRGSPGRSISSRARSRSPRSSRRRPIRRSRRGSRARRRSARSRAASSALPDNRSYTRYADLGRPYVVWNVFAAPELSLTPRQWCFPVAGCVAYRGYFAEADARAEAARLAAAGDDVHVGGVPAYSTLGYFDDPVLSTFVRYREAELARLIFHELAHQVVYVKDDTSFNESFAVAVEEEGIARWLAAEGRSARPATRRSSPPMSRAGSGCAPSSATLIAHDARAPRRALRERRDRRREARRQGGGLRRDARRVRAAEGRLGRRPGVRPLVRGRRRTMPASSSVGALCRPRAAIRALLAAEGGDLPRFYARVKALAALPKAERERGAGGGGDARRGAPAPWATRRRRTDAARRIQLVLPSKISL